MKLCTETSVGQPTIPIYLMNAVAVSPWPFFPPQLVGVAITASKAFLLAVMSGRG